MPKHFQRRKEDFVCGHCGIRVIGNGYTNHCPKCLWSKHVDIMPGDRAEMCDGMMKPIGWTRDKRGYIVVQRCQSCEKLWRNTLSPDDDVLVLTKLPQYPTK